MYGTQKANFGGTGRIRAIGFSIGSKGYVGREEHIAKIALNNSQKI